MHEGGALGNKKSDSSSEFVHSNVDDTCSVSISDHDCYSNHLSPPGLQRECCGPDFYNEILERYCPLLNPSVNKNFPPCAGGSSTPPNVSFLHSWNIFTLQWRHRGYCDDTQLVIYIKGEIVNNSTLMMSLTKTHGFISSHDQSSISTEKTGSAGPEK